MYTPAHRFVATTIAIAIAAGAVPSSAQDLKIPDGVIFEKGIEYSNPDDQHLQVNIARPKTGAGPFPAIVCIHGGGFRAGHRDGYNGLCLKLAERGYVAVTVSYRLAPKFPFPAAVHDTKAAVRWLRAHAKDYKIDPQRIGTTGSAHRVAIHLAPFLLRSANRRIHRAWVLKERMGVT